MASETPERVRLFIGGLGPGVTEVELTRALGALGTVVSIQMVRSRDRDFAFADFEAASPAALRKVFSTYSGCKWKGGCLRVEKAKEDFTTRLQREWAAAATAALETAKETEKQQTLVRKTPEQLKVFFPRLQKVKTMSGKGTGRHKRSFQGVLAHPLAVLKLCDCEDHEDERPDIFDYEHDHYLRLVNNLEQKSTDSDAAPKEQNKSEHERPDTAARHDVAVGQTRAMTTPVVQLSPTDLATGDLPDKPKAADRTVKSKPKHVVSTGGENSSGKKQSNVDSEDPKTKWDRMFAAAGMESSLSEEELEFEEDELNVEEEKEDSEQTEGSLSGEEQDMEEELDVEEDEGDLEDSPSEEEHEVEEDELDVEEEGDLEQTDGSLSEEGQEEEEGDSENSLSEEENEMKEDELDVEEELTHSEQAEDSPSEDAGVETASLSEEENEMKEDSLDVEEKLSDSKQAEEAASLSEEEPAMKEAEMIVEEEKEEFECRQPTRTLKDEDDETVAGEPTRRWDRMFEVAAGTEVSKRKRQKKNDTAYEKDGVKKQITAASAAPAPAAAAAPAAAPGVSWSQAFSWKDLVGSSGSVSFSLGNILRGSSGAAPEPAPVLEVAKADVSSIVKEQQWVERRPKSASSQLKPKTPPASVKSLLNSEACSFMRPAKAEQEWERSRDKLLLDSKAQHKAASRTKKKLRSLK